MKIEYEEWNPRAASLALIDMAETIINEYEADGYTLTLRQLYYQFVSRGLIPNTERSYNNLGTLITKGRMAGFISWESIEDRLREHNKPYVNDDLDLLIDSLEGVISADLWAGQPNYVEVWVEKEALGNVIERPCNKWRVPFMSCKGYMSASSIWRAGQRFQNAAERNKQCHLIHLGDHDPSGVDMTRDNGERARLFSGGEKIKVHRIALNMDQVEEYDPPPNPAKITDSRATGYIERYGPVSWELDALEPSVIEELIDWKISELASLEILNSTIRVENNKKDMMRKLAAKWPEIRAGL